jgi:hypothetical protein
MQVTLCQIAHLDKGLEGFELVELQHRLEKELYKLCFSQLKSVDGVEWQIETSEDGDSYLLILKARTSADNLKSLSALDPYINSIVNY